MNNNKQFLVIVSQTFFAFLFLLSCSKAEVNTGSIVNCSNGTNPAPIGQDFRFPGDLLFLRSDYSEILAFNGETHKLTSVYRMPSDDFYTISPMLYNDDTLAIFDHKPLDKGTLFITILSNRGIIETMSIPFPAWGQNQEKPNSWIPVDWVNEDHLVGILGDKQDHDDNVWEPWLLSLEPLEWRSLSSINNALDPVEYSGFLISPDLTKVLFIDKQYELILYDLTQNKTLWSYSDYDGLNPRYSSAILADAIWSEDGMMLATNISNSANRDQPGILVLDQNGEIVHLMSFGTKQFGLKWANDNDLLTFWGYQPTGLTTTSDWRPVIRMMDMKTGLVRDLCILSEYVSPLEGQIFWSPDQQFLAYNLQNNNAKRNEVIIQKLNDPQLRVIQLDDESPYFHFLGWSKEHWNNIKP